MLDLTCLAYQPISCDRSVHRKRRVPFALSQRKSAYPARTRELDEDEDDKPLVRPPSSTVFEDEDYQPLVQPASRKEMVEEVNRPHNAEVPSVRRRTGPGVW